MPAIAGAGLSPNRARNLGRLLTRRGQRPFIRSFSDITGRTGHLTAAIEGHFGWVRLWFANDGTTAYAVDKIRLAATALAADTNPRDADGTLRSWQTAYADGGGVDTAPGSQTQSVTSLTVPAGSAANPGYACTDWLLLPSVPAADGAWRSLLMARAYVSATGRWMNTGTDKDVWDPDAVNHGRIWDTFDANGDQTTSQTVLAEGLRSPIMAVEVIGDAGHLFLALGDSLTQGQGSTSDYGGWGHLASASLSTAALPISFVNAGWAGQSSQQIYDRGRLEILRWRPSVAAISCWTPNDVFTAAAADLAFARAMALAQLVRDQGGVPILWTPMPTLRIASGAEDAPRLATVARLRAMAAQGWLVADFDAVLSDGATPARIHADWTVDGTHLNDAGYAQCGTRMAAMLRQAIA